MVNDSEVLRLRDSANDRLADFDHDILALEVEISEVAVKVDEPYVLTTEEDSLDC